MWQASYEQIHHVAVFDQKLYVFTAGENDQPDCVVNTAVGLVIFYRRKKNIIWAKNGGMMNLFILMLPIRFLFTFCAKE